MSMASQNTPTPRLDPIAVFGADDAGKPHASRFAGEDAELAAKAADMMGMHVVPLVGAECASLAQRLPQGRVFASGKAFVPFCKKPLYDALAALAGLPAFAAANGSQRPTSRPVVLAGPASAGETRQGKRANATGRTTGDRNPGAPSLPTNWQTIGTNSMVLATTGDGEGWFEAIVGADKGDDLMLLRWRDWPDDSPFLRRRDQLALLPPGSPTGT